MDRGAWWATVHGVTKSRTRLSDFTFPFHFHALEEEMATHSCRKRESERRQCVKDIAVLEDGRREPQTKEGRQPLESRKDKEMES